MPEFFQSEIVTAHAIDVMARLDEGAFVPRQILTTEGWTPAPNLCHYNAERWVETHPSWTVVRGWLVQQFAPIAFLLAVEHPYVGLVPHSVVRNPDGVLVDITPLPAGVDSPQDYPFVIDLAEDAFTSLVDSARVARVRIFGGEMSGVVGFERNPPPDDQA